MNSTPLSNLSLEPVERQTWSQTEGGKIAALLLTHLIEELGFNLHPKELASILALKWNHAKDMENPCKLPLASQAPSFCDKRGSCKQ